MFFNPISGLALYSLLKGPVFLTLRSCGHVLTECSTSKANSTSRPLLVFGPIGLPGWFTRPFKFVLIGVLFKSKSTYITPWSGLKNIVLNIWNRNVEVSLQDLNMLDPRFVILVNNCVYSRLETFKNLQFGQQIIKFSFETKMFYNLISGLFRAPTHSGFWGV